MDEKKRETAEIVETGKILIEIIKADLTGGEYSLPVNCDYKKLFALAQKHKVTYLIAEAVMRDGNAPQQAKAVFQKELFKGNMRYSAQEKERKELSEIFKNEQIKFCFLKGYKLSKFYKEPEKRYMLDMDVYIQEDRFSDAEAIVKNRGYILNTFGDDKDIGYIKQPFLNIEIHKNLKYDYDKGYEYYKKAFERLTQGENEYDMNMTNEDFFVYIVSHSAHHFASGGTGIRNVLDHYYLRKKLLPLCDENKLRSALCETGLTVFEEKLTALCVYWFGETGGSDDIKEMAEYVLLSGVFGNETNAYLGSVLRNDSKNSRFSYIFSRVFPSLSQMRNRYKILWKFPILLPLYWGVRLLAFTVSGGSAKGELEVVGSINESDEKQYREFMERNGIIDSDFR